MSELAGEFVEFLKPIEPDDVDILTACEDARAFVDVDDEGATRQEAEQ